MARTRARTLRQIDAELTEATSERYSLMDCLTRNLDREMAEVNAQIDRLLEERASLTGRS